MIDVTSVLMDITVPLKDLYDEIQKYGWEISKVEHGSSGYSAKLKAPHGEEINAHGRTEADALAKALGQVIRKQVMRTPAQAKVGMLAPEWLTKMIPIAQAYANAPLYDSKAAPAFKELGDDSLLRLEAIRNQMKVEETDDPEPYESADDMREDIQKRKHLYVSRAQLSHPLWSRDQHTAFRAVHDILGHGIGGGAWDWHGHNLAFAAHAPILSSEAQKALFSEVLGRTAYNNHFRSHAPHKIALLTKYLHDLDQYGIGSPPSQTIVPDRPRLKTKKSSDDNEFFAPEASPDTDNAYLWHRIDNLDPLDAQSLKEHAHLLDPNLGELDEPLQRHAVINAARAAVLDKGDPKWRAIHYQDIHGISPDVDDPLHYFRILHDRRNSYNSARNYTSGISRGIPYEAEIDWLPLAAFIKATFPKLDDKDAMIQTELELFHMICEEEEKILVADPTLDSNEVEDLVLRQLQKRLKFITKSSSEKHDYPHYSSSDLDLSRYQAFHHNDLKTLGRLSKNLDEIHSSAQEDLARGGAGHHFRPTAINLGLSPRQASQAWFLLSPKTSQLVPVDNDHKLWTGEGDHYTIERQLAINRNRMGYSHLPLGLFSYGLKDYANYGPFQHPDRQTQAPLNPKPYLEAEWNVPSFGFQIPEWWPKNGPGTSGIPGPSVATVPSEWDSRDDPDRITAAHKLSTPWFIDKEGVVIEGTPGQTVASLLTESGFSMKQILTGEIETGKD